MRAIDRIQETSQYVLRLAGYLPLLMIVLQSHINYLISGDLLSIQDSIMQ
jgi:hypothetical protein